MRQDAAGQRPERGQGRDAGMSVIGEPAAGMPTIDEVAAAAGVSKTTVSHVLSGNRPVAAATRARVEQVIAELGFQPSSVARSLKASRSHTVALVVPDVTNPFYPALARGLQSSLEADGYLNLLADTHGDPGRERIFIADAVARRVDGIVLAGLALSSADLAATVRAGIPVVSVGGQLADAGIDVVTADDARIAADAVRYLAGRGHQRIATVAGAQGNPPGRARLDGFRRGLTEAGLRADADLQIVSDWTRDGGFEGTAGLLALPYPPTAVFCANDLMAIGALDAARAAGVDVPSGLAVIGVDDIDAAALVDPPLTTMKIPAFDIGHTTGSLLLERIRAPRRHIPRRSVLVGHQLITRRSA
ncbi:LacI family DNA-binding transcriptional regulator [Micromonospora auratinigra]|uniref:Transcriptional regulator, LacI family n=1 Tax=Micromonospora auratinigra TaxID=261654 RepID=A0A1A8Z9J1_9ACTN|nr:LacI family DNA-binding transcriptional regulator [Micromonospora auratinigra]SBT40527.1 transcriptional regulator, LacI family [Micromonospora auratinigra]